MQLTTKNLKNSDFWTNVTNVNLDLLNNGAWKKNRTKKTHGGAKWWFTMEKIFKKKHLKQTQVTRIWEIKRGFPGLFPLQVGASHLYSHLHPMGATRTCEVWRDLEVWYARVGYLCDHKARSHYHGIWCFHFFLVFSFLSWEGLKPYVWCFHFGCWGGKHTFHPFEPHFSGTVRTQVLFGLDLVWSWEGGSKVCKIN